MKFKDIKSLDVIRAIENATELFRNKKYQSKKFIEKFIGLNISRAAFYGQLQTADNTVSSLEHDQVVFNSSADVTLLIEGILILKNIPVNDGAGNIVYSGYGLLEVDGVVIYDGRLKNLADQVIDDGCGTTWNTTTGAVDLGGVLNNGSPANNIYFIPSVGANVIRWGISGNPETGDHKVAANAAGSSHYYIGHFDYWSFNGYYHVIGLFGQGAYGYGSGPQLGCLENQGMTNYLKMYKDVSSMSNADGSLVGFPGSSNALLTFMETDSSTMARRQIWESEASNTTSIKTQTFNEFNWTVGNAAGHNARQRLGSSYADILLFNADGTQHAMFLMMPGALYWKDGQGLGFTTVPDGTQIGGVATTAGTESRLHIGLGTTDSYFQSGSNSSKRGIKLLGFGETNTETGAGASYSTLVGTSLVPKKYVDDSIVPTNIVIGAPTSTTNSIGSSTGTSGTLSGATSAYAGLLTAAKFNEIVANTSGISVNTTAIATNTTNIAANASAIAGISTTTNLSEGTTTTTTVGVNSSTGSNATLAAASTSRAGVMTKAKFDEVVANTAKTGITSAQASAITANTAKTGITSAQASAITANTAKVGITTAQSTKLAGIETNADVTDATNVEAAGALMDSEVTNLVAVKNFNPTDYASAGLGVLASNALPRTGGTMTGAIATNSTFDGRDVANDGTKLDTVETNADVTDTTNVVAALTAGTNVTIAGDGTISATGGTASPLTTKGDLYGFDTANQRLGVGTNGQALIANSSTATGLEWQNLPGQSTGSGTKVLVTGSFAGSGTLQTLAVGQTKIEFDDSVTGGTDVNGEWDNTNHRFTVGTSGAGVYIFQASLFVESNPGWGSVHLKKNGTQLVTQNLGVSSHNDSHDDIDGSVAVELAVGDYVEFWSNWRTSTGAIKDAWGKEIQTFSITKVGESVTVNNVVLPSLTKTIILEAPADADYIPIFRTDVAITIQEALGALMDTGDVDVRLYWDTDLANSSPTAIGASTTLTTTTEAAVDISTDPTIPANSWIFLDIGTVATAKTTVVNIRYTE